MQLYWFLASVKTMIYTFNIQVTAWFTVLFKNWQAKDEAVFKQLLKQFIRNLKNYKESEISGSNMTR
jgi:hypothetical protein